MKRRVLVDCDGVLADLLPTWLAKYGETSREWLHVDDITSYGHERLVSEPELFWRALGPALWECMPVAGSSVFKQLCEEHDVYIVTYAHAAAPDAHKAKLAWLARYFPWFDRDRVIFTKHKHLVRGDVLIEDHVENIASWLRENPTGQAYLLPAPYNRALSTSTWEQIAEAMLGENQ